MKVFLALAALTFVTACGDPRTACINRATKDLSVVQGLIAQTELNIDRGYAVETRTRTRVFTDFCIGSGKNNTGVQICNRSEPVERRVPVAIDLNAEAAKLKSLRTKEAQLQRSRANEIQRCQLQYPAT